MQTSNHSSTLATILIGILSIIACWVFLYYPWLSGHYVIPYDAIDENYPTLFFTSQSIRHGQAPWWNPYLFTGMPQIADPQALIFAPLVTLPMAMVANPGPHWLDIIVLVHVLIGGLGVFGFLKSLRLSTAAAIFGAVIAIGGGCAPARLEHTPLIIAIATIPWVGWAALSLLRGAKLRHGVFLGLATGWMGLHLVQTTYIALVLLALTFVLTIALHRQPLTYLRRLAPSLILSGVVTLAICSIQIAALLTFLPDTVRSQLPLAASSDNSAPWQVMLTLLWPDAMHSFAPHYEGPIDITESTIYAGFLTPIAFILGLGALAMAARGRDDHRRLVPRELLPVYGITLVCAIFCFFYALGTYTAFYRTLFSILPGLKLFRRPVDSLFLFTFLLCPFAALGFDAVLRPMAERMRRRYLVVALSLVPIILICWDLSTHTLTPNRANSWPRAMVSDLPGRSPVVAWLHAQTTNPGQPDWRVEFNQPAPFWPDLPAAEKIYSTQGYNPMQISRYVEIFGTTPNGYAPVSPTRWNPDHQSAMFGLLGVKYIAQSTSVSAEPVSLSGLKRAATMGGMTFWENQNRVPRLFSPASVIVADSDQAPAMTAAVTDLSQRAVIEGSSSDIETCGTTPLSDITLAHYTNDRADIQATALVSGGWLVMTDPATRGWHAYIDGKEVRLYRTDSYFRGVCVPAGQHVITFRFEPFRAIASSLLNHLHF